MEEIRVALSKGGKRGCELCAASAPLCSTDEVRDSSSRGAMATCMELSVAREHASSSGVRCPAPSAGEANSSASKGGPVQGRAMAAPFGDSAKLDYRPRSLESLESGEVLPRFPATGAPAPATKL